MILKGIRDITETEAKDLLAFVFDNDPLVRFVELRFDEVVNSDGSRPVTIGMEPFVGILYKYDLDGCVLSFSDIKVIYWLYTHGYDITGVLLQALHLSDEERNFSNLAAFISYMLKHEIDTMSVADVKEKLDEALNTYYFGI